MTPPALHAAGFLMQAHVFTVEAPAVRLFAAREGETWTIHRVTISTADDGTIVRDVTIARDGVRPDRLPAVLLALVGAPATDPTTDKAQLAALGAGLQRGDQGR